MSPVRKNSPSTPWPRNAASPSTKLGRPKTRKLNSSDSGIAAPSGVVNATTGLDAVPVIRATMAISRCAPSGTVRTAVTFSMGSGGDSPRKRTSALSMSKRRTTGPASSVNVPRSPWSVPKTWRFSPVPTMTTSPVSWTRVPSVTNQRSSPATRASSSNVMEARKGAGGGTPSSSTGNARSSPSS